MYKQVWNGFVTYINKIKLQFKSKQQSTARFKNKHRNFRVPIAGLRVAAVMDEFTYLAFRDECHLLQLTPQNYINELMDFKPDLLFIESAWLGCQNLWKGKINTNCPELIAIIQWCDAQNIPTIFWNKEDPVHFNTFLSTAVLFDFVFTTDIDCIPKYKRFLKHDYIYFLPFACQPRLHNPIEKFPRIDAVNFAGAYYDKYTERKKNFADLINVLQGFMPVEIYDRNYNNNVKGYIFPDEYKSLIIGKLEAEQIDLAYKGYKYALNMNSVKNSQTMMARRVFELMASNTITISNYSSAVRNFWGELILCTDNPEYLMRKLNYLIDNPELQLRIKLHALRKVMLNHTYADRIAYILGKINNSKIVKPYPKICLFAMVENYNQLERIIRSFILQKYENKTINIICNFSNIDYSIVGLESIILIPAEQCKTKLFSYFTTAEYIGFFAPEDYYGPQYLLDLALATQYVADTYIISKTKRFIKQEKCLVDINNHASYCFSQQAYIYNSIIKFEYLANNFVIEQLGFGSIHDNSIFVIDGYNYCKTSDANNLTNNDLSLINAHLEIFTGINYTEIIQFAEKIQSVPDELPHSNAFISGLQFAEQVINTKNTTVKYCKSADDAIIKSNLPEGKHDYFYSTKKYTLDELNFITTAKVYFEVSTGLNLQIVMRFFDEKGVKIDAVVKAANINHTIKIPATTVSIQFGLRVYSFGKAKLGGLYLHHKNNYVVPLAKVEYLIITNRYPNYLDLYKNGFIHSRVAQYLNEGVSVEVFTLSDNVETSFYEFEGVNVINGSKQALHDLLLSNQIKTVLVHCLDEQIWDVIQHYSKNIIIWAHGYEIHSWKRRAHNFTNFIAESIAKSQNEKLLSMWKKVFATENIQLVFVSNYLADTAMEDVGIKLDDSRYRIIHNYINTKLFLYKQKNPELRKKILSIRPYNNNNYANELAVNTVLALSTELIFSELEFLFIGDGQLFESTLAPIKRFKNVKILQKFCTQTEIALLHQEYGLFLVPSRMDTQGVSRDEAMASGLVPLTNNVAAIPEFVNESCAILAKGESYIEFVHGIKSLFYNPELFIRMSLAASEEIRRNRDYTQTVCRELELICR